MQDFLPINQSIAKKERVCNLLPTFHPLLTRYRAAVTEDLTDKAGDTHCMCFYDAQKKKIHL